MSNLRDVLVPDIGGAMADVIELLVKPGDAVLVDDALITLEGDKATMEIPSPCAGKVHAIQVKVGDKLSQGGLILTLTVSDDQSVNIGKEVSSAATAPIAITITPSLPSTPASTLTKNQTERNADVHAGPAVRRMAHEFDIDLTRLQGTGLKNRVTKADIQSLVKNALSGASVSSGLSVSGPPPMPAIDFSKFGSIETKPLSKIKKLTGIHVHRSWVTIPHVTQFGQADITDTEAFREQQKAMAAKQGVKLTPIVFVMKAVIAALKAYPQFNTSLDPSGEQLIFKQYFHIGVAVDTPNGLVVPVVRDVDQKGLFVLAQELALISQKAREKGLSPADMQGGCFTISSLGGIGGTAFTPIVNAPEVAILGISKAQIQPIYQSNAFVPRLMLPLSLSYDHRVIDGAEGAKFMVALSEYLADIRTWLL